MEAAPKWNWDSKCFCSDLTCYTVPLGSGAGLLCFETHGHASAPSQ